MKKPVTLIIMDGFGLNPETEGNAVKSARTPNPKFFQNPFTQLGASAWTGLPEAAANVGHTTSAPTNRVRAHRITKSIDDGDFHKPCPYRGQEQCVVRGPCTSWGFIGRRSMPQQRSVCPA